ncbi:MAG TPA: sigma-54 dependent transcriptional regulator [Gammaproteobacteria bacterium]|nr:sigma-54 dependent transcriptional regulator [Gammaproteobacteria bacterium]
MPQNMQNGHRPRALIVDDEPDIRELIAVTLGRMQLDSTAVADVAAAKRALVERPYDLCLTDMRLPDGNGIELVAWMQQQVPQVPVAVITAHGNVESAVQALKAGAFDFVSKPVDLARLRAMVEAALRLPRTGAAAAVPATRLLGESPAMQEVRRLIARVARSQAPVLITGASGTGKELAARLIHESGSRAGKPFVAVNCGAIPTELMESEFFGHRKGSFTGAVADKEGLFQAAEGGTLFLDEVAELPLHMQVKLLRVIQEKALRPVGAAREVPVDVRILSATHRDLAALVAQGRFREDLYYRINVIEVHIPALRERRADIPILARHILARLAPALGFPAARLTDGALAQLMAYDFPGNVRELENVLERALTLSADGTVREADIQLRPPPRNGVPQAGESPLEEKLENIEREAILRALEQTGYNKTAAAKLLGMSFRALRYRIKKLGLDV